MTSFMHFSGDLLHAVIEMKSLGALVQLAVASGACKEEKWIDFTGRKRQLFQIAINLFIEESKIIRFSIQACFWRQTIEGFFKKCHNVNHSCMLLYARIFWYDSLTYILHALNYSSLNKLFSWAYMCQSGNLIDSFISFYTLQFDSIQKPWWLHTCIVTLFIKHSITCIWDL